MLRSVLYILPGTFIPLFVAMDVFVALGIFINLTEDMPRERVKVVIRDSIITALVVGLGFMALGEAIFNILGITTSDFKIAGGLVLLTFALLDLVGQAQRKRPAGKMGVVPLGVPLLVGPAVLTTLIVLVDHFGVIPTIIALLLNLIIVWISFIKAESVVKKFGKGGIEAISKIMALLLAAIAIMMIRLGLEGILAAHK